MLANIPEVLKALPQWVAAGEDKIPINPNTGQAANPSDPSTGGTFQQAATFGAKHIGFILSENDPFTIIDLDNPFERKVAGVKSTILPQDPDFPEAVKRAERHSLILENFPTYAELSQSGEGVHIVMEGKIPCAVKRDKVEIYSKERYMIFTGNVLKDSPVLNCQKQIDWIFSEIGRLVDDKGELIEEEQTLTDERIWQMGMNAANSEKFIRLCDGEWQEMGYPSQSEADFALMSIFAFYTRSNSQAIRLFRQTKLGEREKAGREDYFTGRYGALRKIRSREAPIVDISNLAITHPAIAPPEIVETGPGFEYAFPPGLVGGVAKYIFSSATRQVPEIALAAAIALCAGVCGRSYNISNSGLNQYVIVLAGTGRGKEAAQKGINNLLGSVRKTVPRVDEFMGPASYASGQALVRVLDKKPCFVSILGEVGLTFQQICSPGAPDHLVNLKKVMLDLYTKSGIKDVLQPSAYSDSDKNTRLVQAPNVTFLGESTAENFFLNLETHHIVEGFVSRFMVIEYKGKRPRRNPNAFHPPSDELVKNFTHLVSTAVTVGENFQCCEVSTNAGALHILDQFDIEADDLINSATNAEQVELWNRAHLKALKLSALIAVGCNPMQPVINEEVAKWTCALIRREIGEVAARFSSGDVGSGESKQEHEIKRLFDHFTKFTNYQKCVKYRVPKEILDCKVCPINFLTIYASRLACFKNDRKGARTALKLALEDMVRREVLETFPAGQLRDQFGIRSAIYIPGPAW